MAQSLTTKIRKLSQQFNIDAIISTATQVKLQIEDEALWNQFTNEQKTEWFLKQCTNYGLTARFIQQGGENFRIVVEEFGNNHDNAYFTVFLPHKDRYEQLEPWHLEIGGAYITERNGGIWSTAPGLKGKEKQIAEVVRLHREGA
jgi:hypothetical protein